MHFSTQGAQKCRKSSKSRGRKISPLQSFLFEKAKTLLSTNNKTLILQLQLFFLDSNGTVRKKSNLNVKNLDEEIVVINKKHYKVISGIFHHG